MSDVVLRRLEQQDVALVATFERDIALISFPDDPVTDLAFHEKKVRQAMTDPKADALVAVDADGALVGWVWMGERENFTTRERYGDLRSFYVAEGRRGAGVAFCLMRAILERASARGLAKVVGRTAATNEAMQAIYQVFRFEPRHVVYEIALEGAPAPSDREAAPRPVGRQAWQPLRGGGRDGSGGRRR